MPVLPRTAIWRRRSCSVSETGSPAALVPSRVCSISGRAPEREVMRLRRRSFCGVFSDAGALPDVQRAHPDQSSSAAGVVQKLSPEFHEFDVKRTRHIRRSPHTSRGMPWQIIVAPGDQDAEHGRFRLPPLSGRTPQRTLRGESLTQSGRGRPAQQADFTTQPSSPDMVPLTRR